MPAPVDQTTRYAEQVAAGDVLTCRLVRAACERHLRDLRSGVDLQFDVTEAEFRIAFFAKVLKLNGGQFEGKPFVPQPWQAFIIGSLFGWKLRDGYRRFRTAYIEMGKGTGKSPIAAGIGHSCLTQDNEQRAEVYAIATKREQAMILFRDAVAMVKQSPALSKRLSLTGGLGKEWNIAYHKTNSFWRPLANDDKTQSGFRPHCVLVDELHEHPTPVMVDMARANFKTRTQPLMFEITNSGFNRQSICWEHHQYSVKVLEGHKADDWFAFVCHLDPCEQCYREGLRQPRDGCQECDDWRNEAVWPKTNPNLLSEETAAGQLKYLRQQVAEACGMPANEGIVKRLNFCIWTDTVTAAIPMADWDLCADERRIEDYAGQRCWAGLDLASTTDIAALVLVFPEDEGAVTVFPFFWIPKMNAYERSRRDRVDYVHWMNQGYIEGTEGNSIDYAAIRAKVRELDEKYNIQIVAADPWNATSIVTDMMGDGINVEYVRQGFASMNAPFKELIRLVTKRQFFHGGNPVLRWMASNCSAATDPAGNLKPDKEHSVEKIDGIVAACNALCKFLADPYRTGESVYDTRGFATLGDDD